MKNYVCLVPFFLIIFSTVGCSTNVGTVQDVFPISNTCQEDADCRLVPPVIECPPEYYKCGSCGVEVIDNSKYVSVNRESYSTYHFNYVTEQCDFDKSKIRPCPDCVTSYEYTENIEAKCVENFCVVAENVLTK